MSAKAESASSGLAESYVGSLISLTSKSDIRYQGLFCNLNSHDSTIGLTNVRSFGTEGRKKDGPQVGPSDKVYEYILFRGSDIKDLKVISSPQVQAASTTHVLNDPAILQTHYLPQAPNSSATAQPFGSVPNLNPSPHNNNQSKLISPTFQTNHPLYQPAGNLGPWVVGQQSSLPTTNSNTVLPPMYYPGYYGSSNGFQPQQQQQPVPTPSPLNLTMSSPMQQSQPSNVNPLPSLSSPIQPQQQQSLLTPPPGLSMPSEFYAPVSTRPLGLSQSPSSQLPIPNFQLPLNLSSPMQQTTHHSNTNVPLPMGASSAGNSSLSLSPSALLPIPNFQSYLPTQSSLSLGAFNFQSPISPTRPTAIVSESSTNSVPNNPIKATNPNVPAKTSEPSGFSGVLSMPSITNEGAVAMPNLITPDQLLQPGPSTASLVQAPPQSTSRKDSEPLLPLPQTSQLPSQSVGLLSHVVASESKEPLLPLPTRTEYKPNANHRHHQPRHHYRGGGTQWGRDKTPRPVTVFTEEFDFEAMNGKFNKDEVWGDIGKSIKAQEDANESQDNDNDDDDVGSSNPGSNHAYVKDDFFDSLSCDSIVRNGPQNERPKFSQQRKKDTETFGFVPRHSRGGGRGGYNGYSRGSYSGYNRGSFGQGQGGGRAGVGGGYHGRGGNGYVGRGRGQNFPGRGS